MANLVCAVRGRSARFQAAISHANPRQFRVHYEGFPVSLRLILIRHAKSNWRRSLRPTYHPRVTDYCARARRVPPVRSVAVLDCAWGYLRRPCPVVGTAPGPGKPAESAHGRMDTARHRVAVPAALYHADPGLLCLEVLHDAQGDYGSRLIAHNPRNAPSPAPWWHCGSLRNMSRFADYFPTCATTLIDFDTAHWA